MSPAHRQNYGNDELKAAKDQVRNLRNVYDAEIWLVRWTKNVNGDKSSGLYIGIGHPGELPAPLKLRCVKTEPIKV